MTQTVNEWVQKLSVEPLPVMQRTLTCVRDLLNQTSVNHARLSEAISRDPGFSLYIMQQLNSLPNTPKESITRISLAIPMLGMGLIEQACKRLPCLEDRLKGPPRRGLINCYSRAAHAAFYARGLAEQRNQSDADALYTGALLHDIGEMALWSQAADTMRHIQKRVEAGDERENVIVELLGFTFEELNIQLSERWRLPDLIRDSQGMANSYLPKPLTVMLAAALARETSLGWNRSRTLDDIELLADFLDIPIDQARVHLHQLAAEAARSLHVLPLPLPAYFIICGQQPSLASATEVTISNPKPLIEETVSKPSPHTKTTVTKPTPHTETPTTKPHPTTPEKPRTNPLQELLNSALEQMHHELGLSRTMFAMLTPDRKMLRSRLVIEAEQQLSLKGFVLDTNKPSLFKALLKKSQSIFLNKKNVEKYLPMIPPSAQEQINTSGFVSMSIFINDKAIGLFYADNGLSGPGVTHQQYENFKVICQKVTQEISAS
ncbi:MAG: HDOD domain-containing protein [Candidatus Thiodiazotropha sp.]|jgi:HD-like signal output (HDOD) protein